MTRQPTLKIGILAAFVLLIGALIVVSAFAAPAQQVGTGQPSAKSSAQSVHPAQPTVDGAGRVAANYLQGKRHDARIMTPDNSLSFLPAVTYSSLDPASTSVAVADVNGDGKPDLVVGGIGAPLSVLLGNGDGTFQPAVGAGSVGYSV
jgi:hypothetical protein